MKHVIFCCCFFGSMTLSTVSYSQITLAFQGGESGDTWAYTSTGASTLAISEATQSPNKVTGTTSLVAGGNTGGGNCFGTGSGNGPSIARTFTFSAVDISGSSLSSRTLVFNWGNRFPSCSGTGWDSGENLVFTPYHDGVAQTGITVVAGNNNATYSILSNQYSYTIPSCVTSFSFVLSITTNRADELLFIDDVKLTAPALNTPLLQPSAVSGNTTVCSGATETYSVTQEPGIAYTWSGLPAGASFTGVNGTASAFSISVNWGTATAGTYMLSVTPSGNCSTTGPAQTVQITVVPPPVQVTISGPGSLCSGQTITLTSSYTSGNIWSTGETTQSINVAGANTYSVSITEICGTTTASQPVTVNPPPNPQITGNASYCEGSQTTLTASGGDTYLWSTDETSTSIVVSTPGNYTLAATNSCGTASTSFTVTELPLPTPQISGNAILCQGTTTVFTATGGDTYVWSTNETSASISVTAAGNYTVTATNSCGSATSVPFIVTEAAQPNPQITGNTTFCQGSQTALAASGGDTYVWSTGATTTSITASAAGSYTVTATNSCGTATSPSFTVTTLSPPDPQISGIATFCPGSPTTLTASGGDTYVWSTGATTNSISVAAAGNYTLTATTSCGTATSSPFTVTQLSLPNPQITGSSSFCQGTQTTLTANGGDAYSWSTGVNSSSITVSTAGTYTVTAVNSCGTATSAPFTVSVLLPPVAQISGQTILCQGSQTVLTASGGDSYLWSEGSTTASITVSTAGMYTVTATNACGTDAESVNMEISSITAGLAANPVSGNAPLNVDFVDESTGNVFNLLWDFGDGITNTISPASHVYTQPGVYTATLTVTDPNGCQSSQVSIIEVLGVISSLTVPNVFTPNGDGANDFFTVQASNLSAFSMVILNRWGNEMVDISDPSTGWDGVSGGTDAVNGTYFYKITATGKDNKHYNQTGFFELQR